MDQQEIPPTSTTSIRQRKSASAGHIGWGCLSGALVGGLVAVVASLGLIILLALSEQAQWGHVDWDHAIGLGFLPILAVPPGVLVGALAGVVRALKRGK